MIKIAVITCFFSFGVQLSAYFWYKFRNPIFLKKHQHVLQYYSGIIGDALIIPLSNVFAFQTLQFSNSSLFVTKIWIISLIISLVTTLIFHYGQKYYKLTNWTMTRPGQWTALGLYHAFFMFLESAFLIYTLVSFMRFIDLYGPSLILLSPIRYSFLWLLLFFVTFAYDYRKTIFKKQYTTIKQLILNFSKNG